MTYENHSESAFIEIVFPSLDTIKSESSYPEIFVRLTEVPLNSIIPTYDFPNALFPTSIIVALLPLSLKRIVLTSSVDPYKK